MLRAYGYATITDPDAPLQEYDTASCCHCSAVIFVKPNTKATVYLTSTVTPAGLIVWEEEPGAACWKCGCKPVCLVCEAKGVCVPLELALEQAEKGRVLPRMIGFTLGLLLLCASVVHADESQWFRHEQTAERVFLATIPAYGVLAYTDADGTKRCVRAGMCHEANPVLVPIVEDHGIGVAMAGKLAAQTGIVLANAWIMKHTAPQNRKWVAAGFVAQTVLQGWVVYLNRKALAR